MATWLVLHKKHSGYGDIVGETYEYPLGIANSKQITVGDNLVFCLTKNANDNRRLLGYGTVKELESKPPLFDDPTGKERIAAHIEKYHKFNPPLSFEDIGGDPRNNKTNSINRININFTEYSSSEIISPVNDDFNDKQYYARTIRKGQPKLRKALLKAYNNSCTISGHGPTNVLEACHIVPHNVSGNNKLDNALLLRSDLHCLFDDGLLKINPRTYKIEIDNSLSGGPYDKYQGQEIRKTLDGNWPSKTNLKMRYKD